MPKYIIHIGPPKTGSKYIQSQLFHNRSFLEANGVLYPDNWWNRPDQIFHVPVLDILRQGGDTLNSEFEKINARGFERVILSCEGFDALKLDEIARLRDAIGDNAVDIVYYVRRWSDRIPSDWRQRVMMGQFITVPEFYTRLLSHPINTGEINYSLVWESFARVFGRESLRIVSYSNLSDKGVDLFAHFCRTIVGLPEVPQTRKGLIQHNKGPSMIEAEILRGLNYLYFLENSFNDIRIRIRFLRLKSGYDLRELNDYMQSDVRAIKLEDVAAPLAATWKAISEYQDCLVSPEYGKDMFEGLSVDSNFVGQNYLYRAGALIEQERFYAYVKNTPLDVQELRALQ